MLQWHFSENFRCSCLNISRKWEFFLLLSPSLFGIRKFSVSFFYENWSNIRSKTWLIILQKILGNFLDKLRKIVPEWNAHLEIFSRIQAIENFLSIVCLRTDILQKTVVAYPCNLTAKTRQVEHKFIFWVKKLSQLGIDQSLGFSSPVFPEITKGREKYNLVNIEEQEVVAKSSEPEAQNDTKWK